MNSRNKTILMIVIVLIVLCCVCSLVTAGAAGIFYSMHQQAAGTTDTSIPPYFEPLSLQPTDAATEPPSVEDTEVPEVTPESTQAPKAGGEHPAMGVSRDEMIQFLNVGDAFNFKDPVDSSGYEVVQGFHKTLCLKGDCAAVTLLGPSENLLAVSAAVPTDPNNKAQTLSTVTLLMTVAAHFAGSDSVLPAQILKDVLDAQAQQSTLNKSTDANGYTFTESYNTQSHVAGLAIAKAAKQP